MGELEAEMELRSVFVLALVLWCATAMPLYDEIELLQEDGVQQPAGEQEEQSSESVGCGEIACGKTVDELRREQTDAGERDQDEVAEKMKEIHASFSSSQRDIMLEGATESEQRDIDSADSDEAVKKADIKAASETSLASAGSTYSAATAKAEQEKNSAVVKATATYNEQRIAVQKHAKEQYAQLREDLKANANSIAVTFEHSKNQADALKQQQYTAAKEIKDQKEAKINDMQKRQLDSVHVEHAQAVKAAMVIKSKKMSSLDPAVEPIEPDDDDTEASTNNQDQESPLVNDDNALNNDSVEAETAAEAALPTEPATESEVAAEPTNEAAADPTNEVAADPTNEAAADPTNEAAADPTSEAAADPTNEAAADPTNEAAADPMNEAAADLTNEAAADPTNEAAVDPTNEAAADPTNEVAVDPMNEAAADPTNEAAEEAPATEP